MEELKSKARQNDLKTAQSACQAGLERRAKKIESTGLRWRQMLAEALEGKASPRDAIAAKCRDCVCYEDAVNIIRECTSYTCPLWAYRPYTD